jgi:hypothetical protein
VADIVSDTGITSGLFSACGAFTVIEPRYAPGGSVPADSETVILGPLTAPDDGATVSHPAGEDSAEIENGKFVAPFNENVWDLGVVSA